MNADIFRSNPFEDNSDLRENRIGENTKKIILDWAERLPESRLGLLDLAAGQGIESSVLSEGGYQVTAIDSSPLMAENAYYPVEVREISALALERDTYSGALLKDAWVFMDSDERLEMLHKLHGGLVQGGSVLVVSQWSDTRAHVLPHNSKYPIKQLRNDFESLEKWKMIVREEIQKGGALLFVEYESNPENFMDFANRTGFKCSVKQHERDDSLVQENRWIGGKRFVAEFVKN